MRSSRWWQRYESRGRRARRREGRSRCRCDPGRGRPRTVRVVLARHDLDVRCVATAHHEVGDPHTGAARPAASPSRRAWRTATGRAGCPPTARPQCRRPRRHPGSPGSAAKAGWVAGHGRDGDAPAATTTAQSHGRPDEPAVPGRVSARHPAQSRRATGTSKTAYCQRQQELSAARRASGSARTALVRCFRQRARRCGRGAARTGSQRTQGGRRHAMGRPPRLAVPGTSTSARAVAWARTVLGDHRCQCVSSHSSTGRTVPALRVPKMSSVQCRRHVRVPGGGRRGDRVGGCAHDVLGPHPPEVALTVWSRCRDAVGLGRGGGEAPTSVPVPQA